MSSAIPMGGFVALYIFLLAAFTGWVVIGGVHIHPFCCRWQLAYGSILAS